MKTRMRGIAVFGIILFTGCAVVQPTQKSETGGLLIGNALVSMLRQGGCVIVMRHASSPHEVPGEGYANPNNVKRERQLDESGRADAVAMGKALRDLRIPIGQVLTSPTYRAMETAKLARLPNPMPHDELGDRGYSMQGVSEADAAWLRNQAAKSGSGNTFIVTHKPNMSRAFPEATDISDGEALIFRPDGKGRAVLTARIKIKDWESLR